MTCDERRDIIFLYAAGALEAGEQDELRAHLSGGCPSRAGTLAQAEASLSELPLALPPVAPPAEARDRLMSRIAAPPSLRIAGSTSEPARPRAGNIARWSIISAITGLAAGAAIAFSLFSGPYAATNTKLADAEARLRDLDAKLVAAQFAVDSVNAQNLRLVSLDSPDKQANPASGRILFDEDNGLWHVRVANLKPLPKEKIYELWFILPGAEGKKIAAGTFNTNASGSHTMMVKVPPGVRDIALGAVTEEPAPGVDQPTDPINLKLAGAVERKPV